MSEKPSPTIIVTVSCVRQWGGPQQKSVDDLLHWHAETNSECIVKLEDQIRQALMQTGMGEFAPQPEGAAKALDAMGKNHQCELPLAGSQ